jgi:hypothetical protein
VINELTIISLSIHVQDTTLGGAQDYTDDIRLAQSIKFGGKETLELLKKMTSINEDFSQLFDKIESKLKKLDRSSHD